MNFEKDLFISYAHIDDEPISPEQKGWITQFHRALESFLSKRIGARANIWRDDRLEGNDVFAAEIVEQFPKTALLVSIVSPRYVKSEWCTREVDEFCKAANESGGLVIENKSRVFKVIKTPVDQQEVLPPILQEVLGYEFFTKEDGAPLEIDLADHPKVYKRKINKLAWDIANLLKQVAPDTDSPEGGPAEAAAKKPAVYLADCSFDRKEEREILEGELRSHGYPVLPNQPMPRDEESYLAAVGRLLEQCALAVHLVGENYGGVPNGPTIKSETMLQNELAAARSKSGSLERLIWVPAGNRSAQPEQKRFIESLLRDAEAQAGADLVTGDLEDLKNALHATLEELQKPEPAPQSEDGVPAEDGSKMIYLICDARDREATVPLRKYIRSAGIAVAIPAFEGDASAVREAHRQQMARCDAVVVFYGAGEEAWKRTIDSDLMKMRSYRDGSPLPARFTYLAEPRTADKKDLIAMEEPGLIDGLAGFAEEPLSAVAAALALAGEPS